MTTVVPMVYYYLTVNNVNFHRTWTYKIKIIITKISRTTMKKPPIRVRTFYIMKETDVNSYK